MGRWSSKRRMKHKPAKEGLLYYALCDAESFYTYDLELWVNKQVCMMGKKNTPDVIQNCSTFSLSLQVEGPFNVSFAPEDIVERLAAPLVNSGRNLTVHRYFTSLDLGKKLKTKGLTVVGPISVQSVR